MNLNDYFDPIALEKPDEDILLSNDLFGKKIHINTPSTPIDEISNYNLALIGVPEDRKTANKGTAFAPDEIRTYLYKLFIENSNLKIIDLGNFKTGNSLSDTYAGLSDIIFELLQNQVVSIIIGGSQNITYGCFLGYQKYKNSLNLITIDSTIDNKKGSSASEYYLSDIISNRKLFNFTNLGTQYYLTEPDAEKNLEDNNFNSLHLGLLRSNLKLAEPFLRDADIVSLDIGSLKQSEAPGKSYHSPNGFLSEEICQLSKYAGLSDKITQFGIYEINPKFDTNNLTTHLAAQIIWHFINGFLQRRQEYPSTENKNFKTFIVSHADFEHDITFYKSLITERWWMEIPVIKSEKSVIISCSDNDYHQACSHEIPENWWKAFKKLN